ncbi:DUF998 domain-containing protein [Amycolatopsis sp. NPDC098790]|uniref:DUF998 domain-containing protein n=1 Tax=Amycolatopsis sp. NPDC098790 TaxID=3363939 RepID=UPI00382FB63A
MDRTLRLLTTAAYIWLLCGLGVAVYVEAANAGAVDPLTTTFSEYVHTAEGARLVGVAMLAVGSGALAAAAALRLTGAVLAGRLVALTGVGLGLLAVFPQEPVGEPLTWHGLIHRHVALLIFAALPAAGFTLGKAGRLVAAAALGLLGLFVATFLVDGLHGISGLVERAFLLLDLALLALLARRARPRGYERRSRRTTPRTTSGATMAAASTSTAQPPKPGSPPWS